MPKEAMVFLLVIIGLVGIVVLFGLWTRRKEDEEEEENDFADDPFDDFEDKTFDPYNGKEVVIFDKSKPESNLDVEIARKTAELARLQYEIDQAKQHKPASQPAPKKKKKGGCFSTLCALFFIIVIFVVSGGDDTKNTTPTVRETIEPKATATARPDYYSMPIETVVKQMASDAQTIDCTTRSVEYYPDVIQIEIDLKTNFGAKTMLNSAISYSFKSFQLFFEHPDVPQVYLRFWEPGRDEYGNEIDMCTITMRLKRETYQKINWDFYSKNRYTHAKNYLEILDGHSLHKSYKEALNK